MKPAGSVQKFAVFNDPRDRADHVERVFVVDRAAGRANSSMLGVAVVGDALLGGCAAVATVFDGGSGKHVISLAAKKKP
jgi:hypothetical protein